MELNWFQLVRDRDRERERFKLWQGYLKILAEQFIFCLKHLNDGHFKWNMRNWWHLFPQWRFNFTQKNNCYKKIEGLAFIMPKYGNSSTEVTQILDTQKPTDHNTGFYVQYIGQFVVQACPWPKYRTSLYSSHLWMYSENVKTELRPGLLYNCLVYQ